MVLHKHNSCFITYELGPGIYNFKDISKALFDILQPEYEFFYNSVDVEFDDVTKKTKLVVRPGIIAIRFGEKLFFSTLLGFTPHWDFKHYNEYINQKIVDLSFTKTYT